MSSNYEWQKQYTKQRIGEAQRAAEIHRAARSGEQHHGQGLLAFIGRSLARLIPKRGRHIPSLTTPEQRQTPAG